MSLTIGGVPVPVESCSEGEPRTDAGVERLATQYPVDQTMISRRVWQCRTPFLDSTEHAAVMAVLELRTRQAIGGTLIGVPFGRVSIIAQGNRSGAGGWERAVQFDVLEDSE